MVLGVKAKDSAWVEGVVLEVDEMEEEVTGVEVVVLVVEEVEEEPAGVVGAVVGVDEGELRVEPEIRTQHKESARGQ